MKKEVEVEHGDGTNACSIGHVEDQEGLIDFKVTFYYTKIR
jgi:hypothetical protein